MHSIEIKAFSYLKQNMVCLYPNLPITLWRYLDTNGWSRQVLNNKKLLSQFADKRLLLVISAIDVFNLTSFYSQMSFLCLWIYIISLWWLQRTTTTNLFIFIHFLSYILLLDVLLVPHRVIRKISSCNGVRYIEFK